MNTFIKITANGSVVQGMNAFATLGGEDLTEYIEVRSMSHAMSRSFSGGSLRGHMMHEPFSIIKWLDKASPIIAQACDRGETVEAEVLIFWPNPKTGQWNKHYEIAITNARITSITQSFAETRDGKDQQVYEEVSLAYEKIKWTCFDGNVEYESQWMHGGE